MMLLRFSFIYLLLALATIIPANDEKPVKISLNTLKKNILAISFKNSPHWHTYWINPGDAGLPFRHLFFADEKQFIPKSFPWPAPKKFQEGESTQVLGYEKDYSFFYQLPLSQLEGKKIKIKSRWLVCKNICIPGKFEAKGYVEKNRFILTSSNQFQIESDRLEEHFKALPINASNVPNLKMSLHRDSKEKLTLYYQYPKSYHVEKDQSLIYFYPNILFDIKSEKLYQNSSYYYAKVSLEFNGQYQEPPIALPENGVFSQEQIFPFLIYDSNQKRYLKSSVNFRKFESRANSEIEEMIRTLSTKETKNTPYDFTGSVFLYLLFAFLGGIILNFMPCVLPVISLKLFHLITYEKKPRKTIIKHNIAHIMGIISTFCLFAFIIMILKWGGTNVGWGFQFQNKTFSSIITLLVFTMTLNLFDLFNFNTLGGKFFGNMKLKDSFLGDFLSGILTTILSTPCSAPFLGTAIGFALAGPFIQMLLIFIMVGLGLSSPFILTIAFPDIIRKFPRPGPWLLTLKRFFALLMLFTTIWLLSIYFELASKTEFFALLVVLSLVFSFFYHKKFLAKKFNLISATILVFIFLATLGSIGIFKRESTITYQHKEKFSQTAMQTYAQKRQAVFIYFGADWCLTCKFNEKFFINTKKFQDFLIANNIAVLYGDWTKQDDTIERWLTKQGIGAIPVYFLQKKNGQLIKLGEIISLGKLKRFL